MFRFKVSKFKNAAPRIPKREQCFTDAPIGTLMNSCGNHIAAGCKFIAFNCELGGGHGIGIVGLEDYGRQQRTMPIIHGHSDFVSDMQFSPFDDCLLATGSFDGEVKLWRIPDDGLPETLSHALSSLPTSNRRVDNVLFNPAADGVIAVTSQTSLQIYDISESTLKYEIDNESGELPFQSMDWKGDGSLLVTSCKDTNLRIIDPRASKISATTSGHPGLKDSKTVWLGDSDSVLSTGYGRSRERSVGIWDLRKFASPVVAEAVDNAGGSLMPFYDVDTNMLFLAGKGDSKIYFYEITENATKVALASVDSLETQTSGMAMIPKRAVHLMEAEVNRLLQMTTNCIIPLSIIVPRRSYTEFYPELFPDTACGEASMTAGQWLDGANEPVLKIKLDPKKSARKPVAQLQEKPKEIAKQEPAAPKEEDVKKVTVEHKTVVSEVKKTEVPHVTVEHKTVVSEVKKTEVPHVTVEHKTVVSEVKKTEVPHVISAPSSKVEAKKPESKPKKFAAFRVAKFKHLAGKPLHKNHNIENIKNFDQSLAGESNGLQAFKDLVAYPIAGPGGQIAVVKLSAPGRLPDVGVPVLQNPSALLDFAMDPFDNHLIAAACEDAQIRIWRVPEDGLEETMNEPLMSLTGHHAKVNMVRYNPCVQGLLASASYDLTVKLWDVISGSELITLQGHPEHLLAMDWHPDGHLLATIAKDSIIRVFDPRAGTDPIKAGNGPVGNRGARVVWGGPENNWLIVSGFMKNSCRSISVYDSKTLDGSIASVELDPSPATLMLFYDEDSSTVFATGKGDRTLLAYEISSEHPHIFPLSPYTGSHQHQGLAFLRKDLCDVREIEFAKAVRVSKSTMESISFTVPRVKKNLFQDDIFPDTRIRWEPSMSCEEWMAGANTLQPRLCLRPTDMQPLHPTSKQTAKETSLTKYEREKEENAIKSVTEQKEELMSSIMDKMVDIDGLKLEQDDMEGVEDHEWGDD